ncbi:hypothetical protein CAC42_3626 [Sphaceloma murrayae]|uniref:Endoplasmic reticulum lectin n=1 Tax=Sphaceloma murrayae TaxID=2082308 RepID=A0A2K1QT12_9PEZI|nr:hypothetical protein CAC42_3626 [Sphaceloma murrayae]
MVARGFWALPALLRLAIASKLSFSVSDDLLAHPQYEIKFPQEYISDVRADSILQNGNDESHQEASDSVALQMQDPTMLWTSQDRPETADDYQHEALIMNGQKYLCSIPMVRSEKAQAENATLTQSELERELERANNRGWELLQEMQGRCVYYYSGWWSYRYCFNQGVKQFHQLPPQPGMPMHPPVEDPSVPGFDLGNMEGTIKADDIDEGKELSQKLTSLAAAKSVGALKTRGETKYLVQKLEGGTVCDLTGQKRKIEVQFHCSPSANDHIAYIKELATCTYLMVINTPRLCSDVAFLPPSRDHPSTISCSPVLKPEDVPAYKAKIAARAKKTIEETIPNTLAGKSTTRAPARVGDNIVVGAHRWVPEGREIEKTSIVGGGKEVLVDVIASSLGKALSPEQLKAIGITSSKQIDALKKELDQIAGDKEWKLEVVDTPRGREYRGIIGDDEDENDAKLPKPNGGSREEYERNKFGAAHKKLDQARDRAKQGKNGAAGQANDFESNLERALNKRLQAQKDEPKASKGKPKKLDQEEREKAIQEALQGMEGGEDIDQVVLFLDNDEEENVAHEEL